MTTKEEMKSYIQTLQQSNNAYYLIADDISQYRYAVCNGETPKHRYSFYEEVITMAHKAKALTSQEVTDLENKLFKADLA